MLLELLVVVEVVLLVVELVAGKRRDSVQVALGCKPVSARTACTGIFKATLGQAHSRHSTS